MHPRTSCFVKPVIDGILTNKFIKGYINRKSVDNLWKTELEKVIMSLKTPPAVSSGNFQFVFFNGKLFLAKLLIHGNGDLGQSTYFLPVLVNHFDHFPVFSLSLENVFSVGTPEENISRIVRSALRASTKGSPALLLIPEIELLETTLPISGWKMVILQQ